MDLPLAPAHLRWGLLAWALAALLAPACGEPAKEGADSGSLVSGTDASGGGDAGAPDAFVGEDAGAESADAAVAADAASSTDASATADGGCEPTASAPGVAITSLGAVEGVSAGETWAWLGVPFARPPVGALRWEAPEPATPWCGIRPAQAFPPVCPQKEFEPGDPDAPGAFAGDEDCLYLNVWAPKAAPAASGRPVMVYIHGGGNQQGSSSQLQQGARLFEGRRLAESQDLVVVTLQYRLGPLAWLVHDAVARADGHSGNLGTLDQVAALRFVQENAAAFGGDPGRVTVFGESAGAVNTCMLVASPLAAGLFHRAIIESGACVAKPLVQRRAEGLDYVASVGCDASPDVGACLRGKSAEELVAPLESPFAGGLVGMAFGPVVDGLVQPEAPLQAIAGGRHNHVALVVGSNRDETSVTVPPGSVTPAMVTALLSKFPEPQRSQLLVLYPPGQSLSEARDSFVRATSDSQFNCTARACLRAARQGQSEPVFRYFFTHVLPGAGGLAYGVPHGMELFYVFGTLLDTDAAAQLRAEDLEAVAATQDYWGAFARSGSPGQGDGLRTLWEPYGWSGASPAVDDYLELDASPAMADGLRTAECDVWDSL